MAKRFLGIFSVILIMCVAFVGCPTEENKPIDEGTTIANNNTGGGSSSSSNDSSSSSNQNGDNSSSQSDGDSSSSSSSDDSLSSSENGSSSEDIPVDESSSSLDDSSESSSSDESSSSSSNNDDSSSQPEDSSSVPDTPTTTIAPTSTTIAPNSNKITSLQIAIDDSNIVDGSIIDLSQSQYSEITNFNATINKAITLKNANLSGASLSVTKSGVQLSGLTNVKTVTASASLGNGSLKIASSALSSLNILGGGIHSIYLEDVSVDEVDVNKNMSEDGAEYVRLEVNAADKIGKLTVSSPMFLDGQTSSPSWLGSLDLSGNKVNVAFSKDLSVDTGNFLNVACYNDDASTDRLQMNIVMKKTGEFNTDLFAAAFKKEFGDLTYDVTEFANDIAKMATDIASSSDSSYEIYLVMNSLEVTLIVKDLPDYVGAMYVYGSLPDVDWTLLEDASSDVRDKYLKPVSDHSVTFRLSDVPIKKHKTAGNTDEGFQFYLVPMESVTSWEDTVTARNTEPKGWKEDFFNPSISGTVAATIFTRDENLKPGDDGSRGWCEYVVLHEWCAIGGEKKYVDGEWDTKYPSFNIVFEDLLQPEHYKNNEKYCTITIDSQTYIELYHADPDDPNLDTVPCYPNKVIYQAPTLYDRNNYPENAENVGYKITFSATPNN